MKSKISFVLALIIVLTIIPITSSAEEGQDKHLREAIVKSKKLFNIGSEYDKFTQSIDIWDGKTIFYLNWSDNKDELGQINVSITMGGDVLSYSKWKPVHGEEKVQVPNITKEEALKIAKDFIGKVAPKFKENIKYIDKMVPLNIYSKEYTYSFVRIENGVAYNNNNINISVDNSTGEVKEYSSNWDMDIEFIDIKDIISLEKAKELYKEKIGLDLIYKTAYEDGDLKTFLVYGPLNKDIGINAKDGERASTYESHSLYDNNRGYDAVEEKSVAELNPDEEQAIEDVAGIISKEEAEKVARKILKLEKEYKLRDVHLYKIWGDKDEYTWDMNFEKDSEDDSRYANISVNAKTKKLLSFYKDILMDQEGKVQLNKKGSLALAKEFIKKFNPEDFNNLELVENPEDMSSLKDKKRDSYQFIRKIDNAYVEDDGVFITIDLVNKRVEQYRLTWGNGELPIKDNLISLEKAYETLFKDIEIELKYVLKDGYDIYDKKPNEKKEAVLVYGLKSNMPSNIDAKTGLILNDDGKPYKETKIINYKDIKNSYAKDEIKILAQYNISLPGEEFKPNTKIIQKDFLHLLSKAKYPYFEIDNSTDGLYKYLISRGIVKEEEKAPENLVTKEEAIKYIIRALEYSQLADLSGIYKDIFDDTKDIDPTLKGYVSIAYGLKIVQGNDNNLYPKRELKREDAANMIYNYLFSGI